MEATAPIEPMSEQEPRSSDQPLLAELILEAGGIKTLGVGGRVGVEPTTEYQPGGRSVRSETLRRASLSGPSTNNLQAQARLVTALPGQLPSATDGYASLFVIEVECTVGEQLMRKKERYKAVDVKVEFVAVGIEGQQPKVRVHSFYPMDVGAGSKGVGDQPVVQGRKDPKNERRLTFEVKESAKAKEGLDSKPKFAIVLQHDEQCDLRVQVDVNAKTTLRVPLVQKWMMPVIIPAGKMRERLKEEQVAFITEGEIWVPKVLDSGLLDLDLSDDDFERLVGISGAVLNPRESGTGASQSWG